MFTATPESPCALTQIELLLVDSLDSRDGWGEFEDPLREDLQIIFDRAPPARDADAERVLALAEEIEDDIKVCVCFLIFVVVVAPI